MDELDVEESRPPTVPEPTAEFVGDGVHGATSSKPVVNSLSLAIERLKNQCDAREYDLALSYLLKRLALLETVATRPAYADDGNAKFQLVHHS